MARNQIFNMESVTYKKGTNEDTAFVSKYFKPFMITMGVFNGFLATVLIVIVAIYRTGKGPNNVKQF